MRDKKILEIYNIDIILSNDLDEEEAKEILKKAQEIINEKFDELEYIYLRGYGFKLLKEKGKVWQINDGFAFGLNEKQNRDNK